MDEVAEQRLILREVDHLGDVGVVGVAIVAVGNDGNPDVFYLAMMAMMLKMAGMLKTAMLMFLTSAFSLLIASFTPLLT